MPAPTGLQVEARTRADREGRGRRGIGLQRSAESEQLVNGRAGSDAGSDAAHSGGEEEEEEDYDSGGCGGCDAALKGPVVASHAV